VALGVRGVQRLLSVRYPVVSLGISAESPFDPGEAILYICHDPPPITLEARASRPGSFFLSTSSLPPASSHQLRLSLHRSTVARLLDLQARAVGAGLRKPSYSDLIDALVAYSGDVSVEQLLLDQEEAS